MHQALDVVQHDLPLLAVALLGLLLEQLIDIGVAAIRITSTLADGKGFDTCGGIPRGTTGPQDEI